MMCQTHVQDVISPFKAVLLLALEVWLGLSAAELSDEVVDSEEINLELRLFESLSTRNCTAGMISLNSKLSIVRKHRKRGWKGYIM